MITSGFNYVCGFNYSPKVIYTKERESVPLHNFSFPVFNTSLLLTFTFKTFSRRYYPDQLTEMLYSFHQKHIRMLVQIGQSQKIPSCKTFVELQQEHG